MKSLFEGLFLWLPAISLGIAYFVAFVLDFFKVGYPEKGK